MVPERPLSTGCRGAGPGTLTPLLPGASWHDTLPWQGRMRICPDVLLEPTVSYTPPHFVLAAVAPSVLWNPADRVTDSRDLCPLQRVNVLAMAGTRCAERGRNQKGTNRRL